MHTPNLPIDLINQELDIVKELRYKDVDFTGGEPTIVPNIDSAVSHAKELGMRRISMITNGIAISNQKLYAKLVDSGLNETLFSLHGHSPEVHDPLVGVPRAFERITASMRIAKDLGVALRTNITINRLNYKGLRSYVEYVLGFEPENMNFIFLNPWTTSDVNARELFVRYSDAMPYLVDALKLLEGAPVRVAIRYTPYCVVPEEYRMYIVNSWNRKFDPYEWGYPFSAFTEHIAYLYLRKRGKIDLRSEWLKYRVAAGLYTAGILALHKPSAVFDGLLLRNNSSDLRFGYQEYARTRACSECAYRDLCEGVKREYLDEYGDGEFKPIISTKPTINVS